MAAALFLLGLPLGLAVGALLTTGALDELQREAEQAQLLVEQEAASVGDVAVLLGAFSRESGSRLTLLDRRAGVSVRIDTGPPPADDVFFSVTADLLAADRGQVGRVRSEGMLAVAVPVRGGGLDQVMRASRSDAELRASLRSAWLGVGGAALTALAVAAAVAVWQARRLARPLEELAGSAHRLGEGDFSVRARRTGVPELDEVAAALDATAQRLANLVERSRSLSADASHQLRTPLTALRLQLERLDGAARAGRLDPRAVAGAVVEADRLEGTIEELLTLTSPAPPADPIDVTLIVTEQLPSWQALARTFGRAVVLEAGPVPPVRARPAAISQSLQVLLDNALEHGAGTVTVRIGEATGGVKLCVADEGPGMDPGVLRPRSDVAADRRGRGLPLARALVESEGGRLLVDTSGSHAQVCLLLPAAPGSTPDS